MYRVLPGSFSITPVCRPIDRRRIVWFGCPMAWLRQPVASDRVPFSGIDGTIDARHHAAPVTRRRRRRAVCHLHHPVRNSEQVQVDKTGLRGDGERVDRLAKAGRHTRRTVRSHANQYYTFQGQGNGNDGGACCIIIVVLVHRSCTGQSPFCASCCANQWFPACVTEQNQYRLTHHLGPGKCSPGPQDWVHACSSA